ncbi:pre-rRNA processing protein [Tulasnella sp. 403]|nr:pre-rRNA processing protein [Tulasnella sp. 403]
MPDPLFAKASKKRKRETVSQPTVRNPSAKGRSRKFQASRSEGASSSKKKARLDDAQGDDDTAHVFDDVDLEVQDPVAQEGSGDEFDDETPAQKRLRLAKLYLSNVKKGVSKEGEAGGDGGEVIGWDAEEVDREIIGSRLQKDVLEHSGRIHAFVADAVAKCVTGAPSIRLRGHKSPVTCAVMSEDGRFLFSAGKEGTIVKWDLLTGRRLATILKKKRPSEKAKGKQPAVEGHTDEILALALSSDGQCLASGGKDKKIAIWDAENMKWVKNFTGHKDIVSSLSFRKASRQLFSASYDRTMKLYDLSPQVMGYVETLFGHQDVITSIDSLRAETAVSTGSRDRTVRFWRVVDENQLVFRGGGPSPLRDVIEGVALDDAEADAARGDEEDNPGTGIKKSESKAVPPMDIHEGSMECVAMIDDTTFVSGGDSGVIRLWSTHKKKAVYSHGLAHGRDETHSETEGTIRTPRWITAIAALRYSNVFASGSWDGFIRLWKVGERSRSFAPLAKVKAPGFVNSLQIISPPPGSLDTASWISSTLHETSLEPDGVVSSDPLRRRNVRRQRCVMVAGLGQEPRLGRWMRIAGGDTGSRNGVLVVAIPYEEDLSSLEMSNRT